MDFHSDVIDLFVDFYLLGYFEHSEKFFDFSEV